MKLVQLVGFIIKKFVTTHGHVNVKFFDLFTTVLLTSIAHAFIHRSLISFLVLFSHLQLGLKICLLLPPQRQSLLSPQQPDGRRDSPSFLFNRYLEIFHWV